MAVGDERLATIFELRARGEAEVRALLSNVGSDMDGLANTSSKLKRKLNDLSKLDALESSLGRYVGVTRESSARSASLTSTLSQLGTAGFAGLATGVGAATAALYGFVAASEQAFEFAKIGAEALDVADAFERLGGTASDIEALAAATAGYADETTLKTIHNIAAGYGQTTEELEQLSAAVVATGQATNQSQEEIRRSLETTVKGFGKFSDEALEGLGITLAEINDRIKETVPNFADLTEAEKLAAKQTTALGILVEKDLTPNLDAAGAQFAAAQTNIDNAVSSLQGWAAEMFISSGALDVMQDAVEQLSELFDENRATIEELADKGVGLLIEMFPTFINTLDTLSPMLELLGPLMVVVADQFHRTTAPIDLVIGGLKTLGGTLGVLMTGSIRPFLEASAAIADALGLDIADELEDARDAVRSFTTDALDMATDGLGQFGQGVVNSTGVLSIAVREIGDAAVTTTSYGSALKGTTERTIEQTEATLNLNDAMREQIALSAQASGESIDNLGALVEGQDIATNAIELANEVRSNLETGFIDKKQAEALLEGYIGAVSDAIFEAEELLGEPLEGEIQPDLVIDLVKAETQLEELWENLDDIAADRGKSAGGSYSKGLGEGAQEVSEGVDFFATLMGISQDEATAAIDEVLEDLNRSSFERFFDDMAASGQAAFASILEAGPEEKATLFKGPGTGDATRDEATSQLDLLREQAFALREELAELDAAATAEQIDELSSSLQGLVSSIAGIGDGDSAADALAGFSAAITDTTAEVFTQLQLIEEGGLSAGSALKGGLSIAKAGIGAFAGSVIKDTKALAIVQGLFEVAEAGAAMARYIGSYGLDAVQLASFGAHTLAAAAYFKAAGSGGGGGARASAAGGRGARPRPQQTFGSSSDRNVLTRPETQRLAPMFIVNRVTVSTEQVAMGLNELGRQDRGFTLDSNLISDQPTQPRF